MSENHIPPDPALIAALASATEVGRRDDAEALKICERYELFGDLLLIRVLKPGNRTRGGIYIPDSAIDGTPWQNAEVMAASTGWYNINGIFTEMPYKPGHLVVFFRKREGQIVFPVGNEDMLLIRFGDVGMRVKNADKVTSIVGVDGGNLELPS